MSSDETDDSRMPAYRARLLVTAERFGPNNVESHPAAAVFISLPAGDDASRLAVAIGSRSTAPVARFTSWFMNPRSSLRLATVAAKAGMAAPHAFPIAASDSCV